jgi:lipoprotein-anchoring transpeptidase ErfK/SrfK
MDQPKTPDLDPMSTGRWVEVSLPQHTIKVLEDGAVVKSIGHFATGREGHLTPLEKDVKIDPERRFRTHTSSLYKNVKSGKPAEMPFSLFFDGGCAFHQGDPNVESHGCIHLSASDAEWLFNWVGSHEVHVRIAGPQSHIAG